DRIEDEQYFSKNGVRCDVSEPYRGKDRYCPIERVEKSVLFDVGERDRTNKDQSDQVCECIFSSAHCFQECFKSFSYWFQQRALSIILRGYRTYGYATLTQNLTRL